MTCEDGKCVLTKSGKFKPIKKKEEDEVLPYT